MIAILAIILSVAFVVLGLALAYWNATREEEAPPAPTRAERLRLEQAAMDEWERAFSPPPPASKQVPPVVGYDQILDNIIRTTPSSPFEFYLEQEKIKQRTRLWRAQQQQQRVDTQMIYDRYYPGYQRWLKERQHHG